MKSSKPSVRLRVLAVLTVVGLLASVACSSKPKSDTPDASVFNQATVDAFVRDLAAAGVGTFKLGSTTPVVPVTQATAVRFTDEQATNAALGAFAHAGMTGAQIDTIIVPDPLAAGAAPLPASVIIAAWSQTKKSPAADLARRLLGKQDWANYQKVVFPTAVLALFTADLISPRPTGIAPAGIAPAGTATPASFWTSNVALSICEEFQNFINNSINEVFNAIGHLPTWDTNTGSWWERALKWVGNVIPNAVNYAIDTVKYVVVNGQKVLLGPIFSAIAQVASIIAAVAAVLLAIQPWVGEIRPDPLVAHRSGTPDTGKFVLTVRTVGPTLEKWPEQIEGCARQSGISLPSLKPRDADVKWAVDYQSPEQMIKKTSDTGSLDRASKSTMRYETLTESAEVAAGEKKVDGSVRVSTAVHRTDLEKVAERLTTTLWNAIPLPQIVVDTLGPTLRAIIVPKIKKALEPLTKLKNISSFTILATTYHVAEDPKPSSGPGGPGSSTVLTLPATACQLVTKGEAEQASGKSVAVVGETGPQGVDVLGVKGIGCAYGHNSYQGFVANSLADHGKAAADTFAKARSGLASTAVSGLGDESWCLCDSQGVTLFVRRANIILAITLIVGGALPQAVRLARLVLDRL